MLSVLLSRLPMFARLTYRVDSDDLSSALYGYNSHLLGVCDHWLPTKKSLDPHVDKMKKKQEFDTVHQKYKKLLESEKAGRHYNYLQFT